MKMEKTVELRRRRDEANKRAAIMNDPDVWAQYRQLRNLYNRTVRNRKNADLKSLIVEAQGDQKKLWRHLKDFIDCRDSIPDCLVFNNENVTEPKEISNKLNNFFISSILEIKSSIGFVQYSRDITEMNLTGWSGFNLVSIATIDRIVKKFKTVSGVNNINKVVFKYVLEVCPETVIDLINKSLRNRIFLKNLNTQL